MEMTSTLIAVCLRGVSLAVSLVALSSRPPLKPCGPPSPFAAMGSDGLKGHNIYNGVDFSPLRQPRSNLRLTPSMPHIATLRQELDVLGLVSKPVGKGFRERPLPAFPPAPAPAPALTSSVSLPALPDRVLRRARRPPWALHDDQEEAEEFPPKRGRIRRQAEVADDVTSTVAARRISTRERVWRDNMVAAAEGRGPDPIAIHCLRKHGRRFKPGGLASQTRLPADGGNSTFAIANVRLCTINNGYCSVRALN